MKLKEAAISILINREHTTIEFYDDSSGITFAQARLTPEQLSSALSRLSHTKCEIEVSNNLDILNRVMENKKHEFEVPEGSKYSENNTDHLHKLAIESAPEGWIPDNYYGSQGSFFTKDGKKYARVTIRRWI